MTHTKEPWQVNFADPTQICDCDCENRGCAPIAVMADGDDDAEDNARRIVACVNACEGIETLQLEILDVKTTLDGADALIKQRDQIKQQRDKLLAGIKRIEAAERFTLDDVRFELRQLIEIEAAKS
jgi:small-conductance mechanosensitive channel